MPINPLGTYKPILEAPAINWLIAHELQHQEAISFAAGLVDFDALPNKEVKIAIEKILSGPHPETSLQYTSTQGRPDLREACCKLFLNLEDQNSSYAPHPDEVLITNGSQQCLHLLASITLKPGDIVLTESPTYFVFLELLKSIGVISYGVEMDEGGMVPEALDETLQTLEKQGRLGKVKWLYTVDYYQNPTGHTPSWQRKQKIWNIFHQWQKKLPLILVEDAAYRPLSYKNEYIPSYKSWDSDNTSVAYLGSFSKAFAPGLKCGYSFIPVSLIPDLIALKGHTDFGTSPLSQALALEILQPEIAELPNKKSEGKQQNNSGDTNQKGTGEYSSDASKNIAKYFHHSLYQNQVNKLRKVYLEKAELLKHSSLAHLPENYQIKTPSGGFYGWWQGPPSLDTGFKSDFFKNLLKHQVLMVAGEVCYPEEGSQKGKKNSFRISFGSIKKEKIKPGIKVFSEILGKYI